MKQFLLYIISFLHILFILFVVITPFINSNYFLFLHAIFIPFLIFHWIINDNTCVLTMIERKLRKEIYGTETTEDDCITCKLIEPVYDFRSNYSGFSTIIYSITIGLWLISMCRLYSKYSDGSISKLGDIFKP